MAADEQVSVDEARRVVAETVADAQRRVAERVAEEEALNRRAAEIQAASARMAALENHTVASKVASERRFLRSQLQSLRVQNANAAFGKYLVLGIVLAAMVAGAIAWRFRPQHPDPAYAAPPPPGSTAVTVTK